MIEEVIAANSRRYRHEKGSAAAKGISVTNTVQRKDPFTFLIGTKKGITYKKHDKVFCLCNIQGGFGIQ